jgi:hypothetical protein
LEGAVIPAVLKLGSGALLLLVAVVYWRHYGPGNFLWLSDLGLAGTVLALVFESRLLASMVAVGVLPLEIAWTIDFISGGRAIGLAGYMFDERLPLYLRSLSLFHIAIPPALIFMLYHFGYDPRALPLQAAVTCIALILSYALTRPEKNINWVFGPGSKPQQALPPLLYLGIEMAAIVLFVLVPMHVLLGSVFPAG